MPLAAFLIVVVVAGFFFSKKVFQRLVRSWLVINTLRSAHGHVAQRRAFGPAVGAASQRSAQTLSVVRVVTCKRLAWRLDAFAHANAVSSCRGRGLRRAVHHRPHAEPSGARRHHHHADPRQRSTNGWPKHNAIRTNCERRIAKCWISKDRHLTYVQICSICLLKNRIVGSNGGSVWHCPGGAKGRQCFGRARCRASSD